MALIAAYGSLTLAMPTSTKMYYAPATAPPRPTISGVDGPPRKPNPMTGSGTTNYKQYSKPCKPHNNQMTSSSGGAGNYPMGGNKYRPNGNAAAAPKPQTASNGGGNGAWAPAPAPAWAPAPAPAWAPAPAPAPGPMAQPAPGTGAAPVAQPAPAPIAQPAQQPIAASPSPTPSPSPAPSVAPPAGSSIDLGDTEASATGNNTLSVGAEEDKAAAAGNAIDGNSIILAAQPGAALGFTGPLGGLAGLNAVATRTPEF